MPRLFEIGSMRSNSSPKVLYPLFPVIPVLFLLLLASCATTGPARGSAPPVGVQPSSGPAKPLSGTQQKLVEGAARLLGEDSLTVNGRSFPMDCTGTVLAIYWYAGIDLEKNLGRYTGNGVTRLYRFMEDKRLLDSPRDPVPGDLIFWDNTYDANEDGKFNDDLTHVGMVVYVLEEGTVEYVHLNYRRGIVLERMNLRQPVDRTTKVDRYQILINSPVRARNSPPAPRDASLAGELCRGLGRAWVLE